MVASHLRSLQALELAVRTGSFNAAADALSITPAALGQRIRTLEEFLDTELIVRGRKGTRPTLELEAVLSDLQTAFQALDRVTEAMSFQKASAIHIVADLDLAEHWLAPRLPAFRAAYPNIQFCINGIGDVPSKVGSPDIRIERGAEAKGEVLIDDYFVPVTAPSNLWRVGRHDKTAAMEGVSLLHVKPRAKQPDWAAWSVAYGQRKTGLTRGQKYRNTRLALDATRNAVGFMLCGVSLIEDDLRQENLVLPFPGDMGLPATLPYRLWTRHPQTIRPQLQKFLDWVRDEGRATQAFIERLAR
ncbi:LysR family transcriptional regulator [Pseudaestuariivita atlantica]|uniref:HTH lysR-type domain-containing protein n=1 Tax=Pseudaestuariivita atlantica TaxID=1317121 RepID=A0A0L1JT14_9RHOB|nr:LysR family transcriptional regulator [Pseudaestuariivita atlantica]KNG94847.1 hypothetical protein ATO11_05545 [Pseudaestuariivita atlantica]